MMRAQSTGRRLGMALLTSALMVQGRVALAVEADTRVVQAARKHDTVAVRTLLKQRPRGDVVNTPEADGSTALLWAAHWSDLDMARLLIAAGADVRAANRYGLTPLSEASSLGNGPLIETLLKAGADPNTALPEGETALMAVSRAGNVEAVKLLIAHGANVNAKEQWQGETALMWAVGEGHLGVVDTLLEVGADPNLSATTSILPHRGRRQGRFFVDHPNGGFTALMFAARAGDADAATKLIAAGAAVNHANPDGVTPMMIAIINDHFDLAALLLEKGADPDDGSLYQAIDMHNLGTRDGTGDVTRPRVDHPNTLTAIDLVTRLLARGANPNQVFSKTLHTGTRDNLTTPNATPFFRAARSADLVVMRLLLEKGANPNLGSDERVLHSEPGRRTSGNTGITALMGAMAGERKTYREASERDATEAVNLCLASGADVNAVTPEGDSAVHLAAQRGQDKMIQILADHGARLDGKNRDGLTPLDFAMGKRAPGAEVPEFGPPPTPQPKAIALLRQLLGQPAAASDNNKESR